MMSPGNSLTKWTLNPARIHFNINHKVWDRINNPFPKLKDTAIEVWEWMINFIPNFTEYVITYPFWDQSQSMLAKRDPNI